MIKKAFALIIFFAICASAFAQEETLTFTTYYPSPYGSYNEMRARRLAVGQTYVNDPNVCWENCPAAATAIDTGTNLVVEGNVGIGTTAPGSKLVIKGASADNSASALNVTNSNDASLFFIRNDGNAGIGTNNPHLPAPNNQPGNLDANDIYLRSTGKWLSRTPAVTGVGSVNYCAVSCPTPPVGANIGSDWKVIYFIGDSGSGDNATSGGFVYRSGSDMIAHLRLVGYSGTYTLSATEQCLEVTTFSNTPNTRYLCAKRSGDALYLYPKAAGSMSYLKLN